MRFNNIKFPKDHRPWREILADYGRPIPHSDSVLARSLDALQYPCAGSGEQL
jgi:hypothetical protein